MVTKEITLKQFVEIVRSADLATIDTWPVTAHMVSEEVAMAVDRGGDEFYFDRMSKLTLWVGDTSTFIRSARGTKIELYKNVPMTIDFKLLE